MNPSDFWKRLEAAEAERRARESQTREIRSVRPQFRVAQNDEPEPVPRVFRVFHEQVQAECRDVMRGKL